MEFPNRIKELRESKGMTLDQVAAGAKTSNQQISKLEKGGRRLTQDWMVRVASALGCQPWELLPQELGPQKLTDRERRFLEALRRAPEDRQEEELRALEARYGDVDRG